MPSFIYRFSNLTILFFFIVTIAVALNVIPIIIHALFLIPPSEVSNKLGHSLLSPAASSTGLLIGFLLNQAQVNFREVEGIVNAEAARINNLDRMLLRFGSEQALGIRVKLKAYIESIINDEWPKLFDGEGSHKTHMIWREISQDLFKLEPLTPKQLSLYAEMIKLSVEVADSRETRIDRSEKSLPAIFWIVIFVCLVAIIGLNSLFIPTLHFRYGLLILPIIFGGLISLLAITDQPFKGEHSIAPSSLRKILSSIETRLN